ncbi:MAG: hypothetical protein KIS66_14955 [Fimbriimonadaceae bacterium]|nr:hypothetical protein [Fimbriimonadaceae bacterium]
MMQGSERTRYCGIGNEATQGNLYYNRNFAYHRVVTLDGDVFDAAAAQYYDLSYQDNGYQNPPAGSSWPLAGYWQTAYAEGYRGFTKCYAVEPYGPEQVGMLSDGDAISHVR